MFPLSSCLLYRQKIIDGYQAEFPDYWLNFGNPWEIPRYASGTLSNSVLENFTASLSDTQPVNSHDVIYEVRFYGTVTKYTDAKGQLKYRWEGGEVVQAVGHDVPIPGFRTNNTNNIRLWRSVPQKVGLVMSVTVCALARVDDFFRTRTRTL